MSEWYADAHDPDMAHLASEPNSEAICGARVRKHWSRTHWDGEPKDLQRHNICAMHDRGEIRLVTRERMGTIGDGHGADAG